MKKTFITTLLTLACAAVASAGTGDIANTVDDTQQAGYTGFDFTLEKDWLSVVDKDKIHKAEDITLHSITVEIANTWYHDGPMGVALFEKDGDAWTFYGKSSWLSDINLGDTTFSFDDLELSTSTTYTLVFYGNETAFNELDTDSTLSSLATASTNIAQNPTYDSPLVAAGIRLTPGSAETLYTWDTTASGYLPKVSFKVTAVPEPATATLSLLALAGLAARRRRK